MTEPPRGRDQLLRPGFVGKLLDAVRVDVDQPGRQQPAAAVDPLRSVAGLTIGRADGGDLAVANVHPGGDHSFAGLQGTHVGD